MEVSAEPDQITRSAAEILAEAARLRAKADHAGAARILQDGLGNDQNNFEMRLELVAAFHSAGNTSEARNASLTFEKIDLDESKLRKLLSLFRSVGDNMRAQLATLRFLKANPENEWATLEMIRLVTDAARGNEALERIDKFLKSPSLSAMTLFRVSQCQIRLNRFEAAAVTARRSVNRDPNLFEARVGLMDALYRTGCKREIRLHLSDLLEQAGDDVRRWAIVAEVASWAMQKKVVAEAVERVSAFDTVPYESQLRLARAYMNLRCYAQARIALAKVNPLEIEDVSQLQKVLKLLDNIIEIEGPFKDSCEFGAKVTKRLIDLFGSGEDYKSKLLGFQYYLS